MSQTKSRTASFVYFFAALVIGLVAGPFIKSPRTFFIGLIVAISLLWAVQVVCNLRRQLAAVRALRLGGVGTARKQLNALAKLRSNPKVATFLDMNESVALILEERYSEARATLEKVDKNLVGANSAILTNNIVYCDVYLEKRTKRSRRLLRSSPNSMIFSLGAEPTFWAQWAWPFALPANLRRQSLFLNEA